MCVAKPVAVELRCHATALIASLIRLYKTIESYDVLLGIFSGKLGTQQITQKAIEAEARGDYSSAKKLYEEVNFATEWHQCNLEY